MTSPFDRQSFLGVGNEGQLRRLKVAIIGLGGGGSHIAQQLGHIGVGHFLLIDPDRVERSNLNRLVGASLADANKGETKVRVSARMIRRINPRASIRAEPVRWQEVAELLRGFDFIFGCIDSFMARDELERSARRYLIPYIDIGMDVFEDRVGYRITGQVAVSMPGRACLHCMNVLREDLIAQEVAAYGAAGHRPQVIWPNGVLASTAVGLMMSLVTPWQRSGPLIPLLEYDGNQHEIHVASSLAHILDKSCNHFPDPDDLGDPWFALPKAKGMGSK